MPHERIVANEMRRDNRNIDWQNSSFSVILDTFYDHRNGFLFRQQPTRSALGWPGYGRAQRQQRLEHDLVREIPPFRRGVDVRDVASVQVVALSGGELAALSGKFNDDALIPETREPDGRGVPSIGIDNEDITARLVLPAVADVHRERVVRRVELDQRPDERPCGKRVGRSDT